MTTSSRPIDPIYDASHVPDLDHDRDLGAPGDYPFTRGVHSTGYRGKLWTMRMFAGFGSAEETNERFKTLLTQGNKGLSVAFDMATLYGYDSDAPEALGEFGVPAVADDDPNVGEFHDTGSSIEDGDHAQQQPDRVGVEDDSD